MTDSTTAAPDTGSSPTASPAAPPPRPFLARVRRWLLILVLLVSAGSAFYTWGSLRYVYSSGERAGYVQKFSHEGWLCKTWEGELAMVNVPGQPAELFPFSVRDDAIAVQIQQAVGKRVALTYQYHPGVPTTCFGDTKYHVVGVRVVDQP